MKFFVSWSGEQSRKIAEALAEWLPVLLDHRADIWLSTRSIGAGERWGKELNRSLNECAAGIFCVTRENVGSAWMAFEAGALSRSRVDACVFPYLIGVDPGELVHHPFSEFQGITIQREGTWMLITALNKSLGNRALDAPALKARFRTRWPQLYARLALAAPDHVGEMMSFEEMVGVVLEKARKHGPEVMEKSRAWIDRAAAWIQRSRGAGQIGQDDTHAEQLPPGRRVDPSPDVQQATPVDRMDGNGGGSSSEP